MDNLPLKTQSLRFIIFIIYSTYCWQPAVAQDIVFDRIINNGELVVGMSGEQPPFNFVTVNNNIIGYDVELAALLADLMGVKVKFMLMPFADLASALTESKIDMIISGFTFSKEHSPKMTFIGPYALSGKSILINKSKLQKIKQSTGFNHQDVRLVALKGSTSLQLAKRRLPKAHISATEHYEDALLALHAGQADAVLADITICKLAVMRDTASELTTLKKPVTIEEIAIAISKDETQLQKQLVAHLFTLGESGKISELQQRWFYNIAWAAYLP